MRKSFYSKSIFAVLVSFFAFQLYLFVKSFPVEYNLYLSFLEGFQGSDPFWLSLWFSSELVGEVGLVVRFAGACIALVFAWLLIWKRQFALSHLRKAVLFEGAYYLFILPFIVSLFARPNTSIVNVEAGLSYSLQIALVSTPFLILYTQLNKPKLEIIQIYKWGAIAIIGFTFALWIKHFLLNLYALPINFADPVLIIGFLNSTLTLLFAGIMLLFAFLPIIRKKQISYSSKTVGIAFLLIGLYFLMYIMISLWNQRYLNFLTLTELWGLAFMIPGVDFLTKKN